MKGDGRRVGVGLAFGRVTYVDSVGVFETIFNYDELPT